MFFAFWCRCKHLTQGRINRSSVKAHKKEPMFSGVVGHRAIALKIGLILLWTLGFL